MDPERLAELAAAVQAQEVARLTAERQITSLAVAAVRDFSDWYSTSAITAWTRALVSRVEPVQRVLARSTDAYLARVGSITTGRSTRPVGAVDVSSLRSDVTHAGAYGRVANTYRYQESRLQQPNPPQLVSPQQAAVARATAVAQTDAMLVPRAQAQKTFTRSPKITGYRRVIHPELAASGTCGLCLAASDRLYGPQELMPIHDRCNCLQMPVYDGNDPGSTLNRQDLELLYSDAGGTAGEDLKRTKYKVVQHSELGPTLVRADATARTPADVKRDQRARDNS